MMSKLFQVKRKMEKTPLSAALLGFTLLAFLVILPAVQAQPRLNPVERGQFIIQQVNQGSSESQLRIDENPLLGLNVLAPSHAPSYYDSPVTTNGEVVANVGNPCPSGYTTSLATVGFAWVGDSGPVDIQFVPTQERGHSIGLLMWDPGAKRWWCTDSLAETNTLHFTNMSQGMYFMWVLTQDKTPVEGDISVVGPPPAAGS
jgi:hypothetical protein